MKKGKYLITGCAGFIGSHLVKNISDKYELVLVDDFSEGSIKNIPKKFRKQIIKKKIQDLDIKELKKIDGIFHLAAQAIVSKSFQNPLLTISTNVIGTVNILESLKSDCKRLTFIQKLIGIHSVLHALFFDLKLCISNYVVRCKGKCECWRDYLHVEYEPIILSGARFYDLQAETRILSHFRHNSFGTLCFRVG